MLLETVANEDDTLAEMFLEEIPPTEEQLIVSIVKIVGLGATSEYPATHLHVIEKE